jgi:autotransporter-associated beta strand protein
VEMSGAGNLVLAATNSYTGGTNVNSGTLDVTGSTATSSGLTVNSGGTVGGTGTVGNTQVNSGGTFAPGTAGVPGTSMTVAGSLAFQSGAIYLVQVNPSSATSATVTGTASLDGNVLAAFAPGSYVSRQYTILRSAGLSGTFNALGTTNLPAGFSTNLSYTNTDVILNLAAVLGLGGGLSGNQQNVSTALNNFFNGGGTLTPNFLTIFGLTGGNLAAALSQLAGEAATGAQHDAFQLMSEFLGLMFDPYSDASGGAGGPASAFAAEQPAGLPADVASAYAAVLKAPTSRAPSFERRWRVWASGFGGYNATDGDTGAGTHDLSARTYGGAAGLDYGRSSALRSPAAAPAGVWPRGWAAAAAMRSWPACTAGPI